MCPERSPGRSRAGARRAAYGVITVELAFVLGVFLLFVFVTIEVARFLFVVNTAQEVTRRAARAVAMTDPADGPAMAALRYHALFRDSPGSLLLLPELTPDRLRVEYLSLKADGTLATVATLPACPELNVANCMADPNGAACIRFVRVSICGAAAGACEPLRYRTLTGLVPQHIVPGVPLSSTIAQVESLGIRPGTNTCL